MITQACMYVDKRIQRTEWHLYTHMLQVTSTQTFVFALVVRCLTHSHIQQICSRQLWKHLGKIWKFSINEAIITEIRSSILTVIPKDSHIITGNVTDSSEQHLPFSQCFQLSSVSIKELNALVSHILVWLSLSDVENPFIDRSYIYSAPNEIILKLGQTIIFPCQTSSPNFKVVFACICNTSRVYGPSDGVIFDPREGISISRVDDSFQGSYKCTVDVSTPSGLKTVSRTFHAKLPISLGKIKVLKVLLQSEL